MKSLFQGPILEGSKKIDILLYIDIKYVIKFVGLKNLKKTQTQIKKEIKKKKNTTNTIQTKLK